MWRIKLRAQKRMDMVSVWAAFFVPGVGFIATGFCIVGWILILLSIGLLVFILFKPLKNEIPQLEYAAKHSKIVWGLWFTGDRHFGLIIQKHNSIKKVLLMKPDSLAFNTSTKNPDRSNVEIRRLTQHAIQRGIAVRWYTEPQESSLTIYDPIESKTLFSNEAYYIVSKLERDIPRKDRVLHILKKKEDEEDFNSQVERFNKLWDRSSEPNPKEYKEYSERGGGNISAK